MILSAQSIHALLNEKNDKLKQTLETVLEPNRKPLPIHPDYPDIFMDESDASTDHQTLQTKLELALSGILTAEQHYRTLYPDRALPTQSDHLQIPVLTCEIHPHGVAAPEILDTWKRFYPKNTSEYIAACAVEGGCPITKIGRYQTVSDSHLITLERTSAWGLLYAGEPKYAAEKAFQDASLTAGPAVAEAAAFVAAMIAYGFYRNPQDASGASLYGMPLAFIETVHAYSIKPIQPHTKPSEHCALLYTILQNSGSLQECLERLDRYHAEAFCYFAAGAVFGANSSAVLDRRDSEMSGMFEPLSIVSKQDLAERYTKLHPKHNTAKMPWE